jgi:hypothetical protein|tara:strand:+ start:791 stop:1030 length:240 start_codon:yes stop_codon:yes gene_type:complete
MSKVDAVITSLEMQIEQPMSPWGSHVAFRYIDTYPDFPKTQDMIYQVKIREDVKLVDYEYTYTGIDEDTNLKGLEFTKN